MMSDQEKQNDTTDNLETRVEIEKLELLYRQSFPAIFVSAINGILVTAILWPAVEHTTLLSWLAVLLGTAVIRLGLFAQYHRTAPQAEEVISWEKPYFITLMLTTLTWGVGCVILMPQDSFLYQVVLLCFMVGMSGGAISLYSAHYTMTMTTILTLTLPITIWFLIKGTPLSIELAIGSTLFFLSAVKATKVLNNALHDNFKLTYKLKAANEVAERLARVDELTELFNRRAFYEHAGMFTNYSRRHDEEFSLILLDIDHFKSINDTMGHAAGDEALKKVGLILRENIRGSDIAARIGGEEFAILLMSTSTGKATQIAEKIRHTIENQIFDSGKETFRITASFGIAGNQTNIEALLNQADEALYEAKSAGRNKVIDFQLYSKNNSFRVQLGN